MCLRFVFLLIMRLATWLRLSRHEETWKTAEILILRHQLTVLQRRQPRRPNLDWADRALHRTGRPRHRFKSNRGPRLNWRLRQLVAVTKETVLPMSLGWRLLIVAAGRYRQEP